MFRRVSASPALKLEPKALACLIFALALLSLLGAATPSEARQAPARKIALVIGISSYENVEPLRNAHADAQLIADTLSAVGFDVDLEIDPGIETMRKALATLTLRADGADIALIYFAGHGIEVSGQNFLLARDSEILAPEVLETVMVSIVEIEAALTFVDGLRLILLDACRDNPFADTTGLKIAGLRGNVGPRGAALGFSDLLISYAAMHGTTASDGSGRNSPFAEALNSAILSRDGEVNAVLGSVRDQVVRVTQGSQLPFTYGSIGARQYNLKDTEGSSRAREVFTVRDHSALLVEVERSQSRVRRISERISLATKAEKSFEETEERIRSAIQSLASQAAACHTAKAELDKRRAEGAPEWALADGEKHVRSCKERAERYSHFLDRTEREIKVLLPQIDEIRAAARRLPARLAAEQAFEAVLKAQLNYLDLLEAEDKQ